MTTRTTPRSLPWIFGRKFSWHSDARVWFLDIGALRVIVEENPNGNGFTWSVGHTVTGHSFSSLDAIASIKAAVKKLRDDLNEAIG